MGKVIDLQPGQKFGRLTVVERAGTQNKAAMWHCLCDCGRLVVVQGCSLRSGHTKSCGCLKEEKAANRIKKLNISEGADNRSKQRLYQVWKNMNARCGNPDNPSYSRYGGRGIKVCPEWEFDYWAFEQWAIANGWREGLTLDRIDNNEGYCPENCRWATAEEQGNNRRSNVVIIFRGKPQTLSQWARELGISRATLNNRYKRGWSVERMLTEPVKKKE